MMNILTQPHEFLHSIMHLCSNIVGDEDSWALSGLARCLRQGLLGIPTIGLFIS